ncbi:hypothetical protein RFI_30171 [Reticulomyxa filosa]|uniref:Uncharacterized protein n=1 Tax=Reticulomyxa filosa TaxID=46433 RepID=X6M0T0_RETFI|nr:hypothetical protein RFI_30171 [Reticulomyxa filosa]|eukprot:ETO07221.1 hypothetical protein RFI_30171 [Reticulomyxa filosa]
MLFIKHFLKGKRKCLLLFMIAFFFYFENCSEKCIFYSLKIFLGRVSKKILQAKYKFHYKFIRLSLKWIQVIPKKKILLTLTWKITLKSYPLCQFHFEIPMHGSQVRAFHLWDLSQTLLSFIIFNKILKFLKKILIFNITRLVDIFLKKIRFKSYFL